MPRFLSTVVFLLAFAGSLQADDWPQWRGPERDGVWRETGILDRIPESGLTVRWRARVGNGYSGPVVAKGRVFVSDHLYTTEVERVLCFDQAIGKSLWQHSYPCPYADMEYGNGPRAAPTVHDGRVYAFGTKGHLVCLDAEKGELIWKKDLVKEVKARIPQYGASAAPLIEGELLIVMAGGQADGTVMAFDRRTGAEKWRALSDRPSYSAPIVVAASGARQLIVWTADSIASLEPATGKVFWQVPWKATFDPAQMVASPVLHKDKLLFLGAWSRGSKMLQLETSKPAATVVWETGGKPTTTLSTPLFADEKHFYGVLLDGNLACLDAESGDQVWATAEPTVKNRGNAHFVQNGDRTFLFNQSGHLVLARLTPKGYQELGRTLLVEPTAGYRPAGLLTWAHPAFADKCVFARNDRELVCASLAADTASTPAPKQTVPFKALADFANTNAALGLAFSPDGKLLALGTWSGNATVIDVATGKAQPGPPRHNDWVCSVAFSRDGKYLASAGGSEFRPARNGGTTSGQIKLWDRAAAKEVGPLKGHTSKIFSAAFSPDSKTLATASADRTVRLWDAATGTERLVLKGHKDAVWSAAFFPDGKSLATGSADGTVKIWDAETDEERLTLKGHDEEVLAVAISPDGKTLASGGIDRTVRLWDPTSGRERTVLKGHRGSVTSLAFTSDSKTLASGSGDETAILWDAATGTPRTVLRGHRSGIAALAFSPDDRTLATSGQDDAVRLWDVSEMK